MMSGRWIVFAMFVIVVFVAGCGNIDQTSQPSSSQVPDGKVAAQPRKVAAKTPVRLQASNMDEYRIGAGDVIRVSVWKNEDLSRTVPVRPDGMISLPLLNEVRAAGLTPTQLRNELSKKLSDYTDRPEVSVIVEEVRSFTVSVLGEVRTPGRYELRSKATVLDAVAVAGGFSEFASRGRILILRSNKGGEVRRIAFDYNKAVAADGTNATFFVEPGDVVVVP